MQEASWNRYCPVLREGSDERVTLSHGEGGRLMRQLITERIQPRLTNPILAALSDAATLPPTEGPLAITTDSFVVSPLFFPGGDIGTLAVYGTVNDLAVSGAKPQWLTLALIIEEGLPMPVLERVVESAARAAACAGVAFVAGDTKVVPRGAADGLFINTTGVGSFVFPAPPGPAALRPGDEVIVSGSVGRHGIAILNSREELGFGMQLDSDCGPLTRAAQRIQEQGTPLRSLRDATRGGVAAVMQEWAQAGHCTIAVDESAVPVEGTVRGACELLGLDPMHIACEGTMLIAVEAGAGARTVELLRALPETSEAAVIGTVHQRGIAPVVVHRLFGREQPLDEPLGAPLPRIC